MAVALILAPLPDGRRRPVTGAEQSPRSRSQPNKSMPQLSAIQSLQLDTALLVLLLRLLLLGADMSRFIIMVHTDNSIACSLRVSWMIRTLAIVVDGSCNEGHSLRRRYTTLGPSTNDSEHAAWNIPTLLNDRYGSRTMEITIHHSVEKDS